jgi:hypothetical protein
MHIFGHATCYGAEFVEKQGVAQSTPVPSGGQIAVK